MTAGPQDPAPAHHATTAVGTDTTAAAGTVTPDWRLDDLDLDRYLRTLGVDVAPAALTPDLALLERLHDAHVRTLPFSNLGVLLGGHPGADLAAASRRLLQERTGGLCYEHAAVMAAALERLGYTVLRHLGRVRSPLSTRTHVTVEVRLEGRRWLLDPGFGLSITGPIELTDGAERVEGHGTYRVDQRGAGSATQWVLTRDGDPQHFTDELPTVPKDLRGVHTVVSTDPESGPFLHGVVVNRHTADGHLSITDGHRVVRRAGQETVREEIGPDDVVAGVREAGGVHDDDAEAALRAHLAATRAD